MTEAALYITASSLTVAFASFISYSAGEDKWQKFALGAILMAMLAGGAKSALGYISEGVFEKTDGIITESTLREDTVKESFESGIARLVAEELSCESALVKVNASGFDLESVFAEKITVHLYGKAALGDYRKLKETLKKNGFENCEVVIYIEKSGS